MTGGARPNDRGPGAAPRYSGGVEDREDTPEGTPRWDRRRTIGAVIGGVLIIGVVALLVVGLTNKGIGTSIQDSLKAGERPTAPALALPVLTAGDGVGPVDATVSLADLRGRVVVLNFWASWCDPCQAEAPILEAVAERYRGTKDVVVLGVDVQDLREDARAFVKDNGVTYPVLRDGSDGAQHAYQVPQLPETFIIDRKGRVGLKVIGQVTDERQLVNAIEQLRAEAR